METVVITLNGTPVSGRSGMTILELAREVGVYIPTLCHDPHLKPVGACRICLVEEEKSGRLLASCVTPIAPGMVINTQSRAVIENRRVIVKLMLASHPESCILCDKGNRCQLRKIASELGIGLVDYYRMPQFTGIQEANPFILRDLSKCILCGKCIRADQELVVVGALEYMNRGFDAKPATLFNGPLESSECTFCGTCVTLCPTGALQERGKHHIGTAHSRTKSICSYCGCGCNIYLETHAGGIVYVSPDPASGPNGSCLCVKGHYGSDYIHHQDRLKMPMIRKNRELKEVEWEEAIDFVADGLRASLSKWGPDGMAFLGSSKCTNEENYLFQKMARVIFGTNNIDNGARLHSGPSLDAIPFGAMTNPIQDIEDSEVIVILGSNPSASHPIASYRIKRAIRLKGAVLIVVDPKRIDLVHFADKWVRIQPGSDGVFLNGILKGLLEMGGVDKDFVMERTTGLSGLRESLESFDMNRVEELTGCPPSTLEEIIEILKEAGSISVIYGYGITHQPMAAGIIRAIASLCLLKGSIGKTGCGIYPLDKENNAQGAWDMGSMPSFLPGHISLDDEKGVEKFSKAWKKNLSRIPGKNAIDMILSAERGEIKALYVMGENPVRSFPASPRVESALAKLDFFVVQDLFLTETASMAHAVLPSASFAEKDGTFTNIERRIQRIRKAVEPFQKSLPDWEIICRISEKLGYSMPYASVENVMKEISFLVPIYSGISYKMINRGGVFWPCSEKEPEGERRPFLYGLKGEKAQLLPAPTGSMAMADEEEGPFILLKGSYLYHFMGGTRSMRSARLRKIREEGFIEMNSYDAKILGVKEGDILKIYNKRGEVSRALKVSESVPKGMIFTPSFDMGSSCLFPLDSVGIHSSRIHIQKER